MWKKMNAYTVLVGMRPLEGPRPRWKDNINIDPREIGWCGWKWINLAEDKDQWQALVNVVMNCHIP
jgi:hypothetical protein